MKITDDPELRKVFNKIMNDYQKRRYAENPEYREKKKASNLRWRVNNTEKYNEYMRKRHKALKEGKNANDKLRKVQSASGSE